MQKTILKFPSEYEFNKFIKYLVIKDFVFYPENLTVQCIPNEIEKRLALDVFNAEVIE